MTWYILRIQSRLEQRAEDALKESGYDVYCPRVKVVKLPAIKKKLPFNRKFEAKKIAKEDEYKTSPLYPGYTFARQSDELGVIGMLQDNHGIKRTGVLGIIRFGERLATVSDEIIDDLKYIVESGLLNEYSGDSPKHNFKVGQMVQYKAGPLAGSRGVVEHVDKSNKIRVLTELLGSNRPVVVTKLDELEALS